MNSSPRIQLSHELNFERWSYGWIELWASIMWNQLDLRDQPKTARKTLFVKMSLKRLWFDSTQCSLLVGVPEECSTKNMEGSNGTAYHQSVATLPHTRPLILEWRYLHTPDADRIYSRGPKPSTHRQSHPTHGKSFVSWKFWCWNPQALLGIIWFVSFSHLGRAGTSTALCCI